MTRIEKMYSDFASVPTINIKTNGGYFIEQVLDNINYYTYNIPNSKYSLLRNTKDNFNYYVYIHIRNDNNSVFYVGIGTNTDNKFKRAFVKNTRTKYWKNIANKTEYTVKIIFETNDYNLVNSLEIALIKYYGRKDLNEGLLVNNADGGHTRVGYKPTMETLAKLSKSLKGRKISDENKLRLSKLMMGNKIMLGRKLSEETRLKIKLSNLGKKMSKESIEKIRKKNIGKKRSPEAIENIRKGCIGRKQIEETIEKRVSKFRSLDNQRRRFFAVYKNKDLLFITTSIKDLKTKLKISQSVIYALINDIYIGTKYINYKIVKSNKEEYLKWIK